MYPVPTYFHSVHMRKRACPLAKISLEFADNIGRGDENFRYQHAIPFTGMK